MTHNFRVYMKLLGSSNKYLVPPEAKRGEGGGVEGGGGGGGGGGDGVC